MKTLLLLDQDGEKTLRPLDQHSKEQLLLDGTA